MNDKKSYYPWGYDYTGDGGTGMIRPPFPPNDEGINENEMKEAIDNAVNNLVNGAPEALDTLKEIADVLKNDDTVIDTLFNEIDKKINDEQLKTYVTEQLSNYLSKQAADNMYQPKGEYLTEHQDLSEYAKSDDVTKKINDVFEELQQTINNESSKIEELENVIGEAASQDSVDELANRLTLKANSADVYTKTEIDSKGYLTEHQDISNLASKEEVSKKQDKGNYLEYADENGRKVITFNNDDIIGAIANNDELDNKVPVNGWISLMHLNKWNVVDVGSPKTLTNINTPDGERPTVQEKSQSGPDAHKMAYLDDIEKLETKIESIFKCYKPIEGDELVNVMKKGGDITLPTDVNSSADITLTKKSIIDMNGHSVNSIGNTYGDAVTIGNGADVTFKNGTINYASKASVENNSATVMVATKYPTKVTFENMNIVGHPYGIYMNNTSASAIANIESGNFYTDLEISQDKENQIEPPAVYVEKKNNKVNIKGGTFGKTGQENRYLLNIKDVLTGDGVDPRNFIEVTGGSFYNFNPADCISEGEHTNFVADGYKVVSEQVGGDMIYTVVKE